MPTVLHTEASRGLGGQELRILAETRWLLAHGWGALIACQPESPLLAMRSALDLRALAALRRLMRAGAVSLVHTHSSVDAWLGAVAAKSLGLPVVRGRHVSIPIRRSRALVYRLADRVITSGEAVRALVLGAGIAPARVVSIPPGVDTARFHPGVSGRAVREELGIPAGAPAVGLVANIRGSKGHNVFLEAAREILHHSPHARFLIVGDGVGFAEVRQRVRDMGLEPAVTMTGFRRDIPEIMAALDVLVLPSLRSEATPQVIPQALAVGTPVVASTVGGNPELVRDGDTGRLVAPGDPHALAHAVLSLLADPDRARALARAGQAAALARYSIAASMALTTEVYRGLLAQS
ncbi:MAG: glycosyltransferase [Candidatus Rokubacteria bacterium]|nr:glycosyltransferase [Candidatus Rokubacteria bacterium]